MLREWLSHCRFVLRRKNRTDVDEELRFHLDNLIAQKIAVGLSPEEARRQARIEFGGIDALNEQCDEQRPSHVFETLFHDFRFALRGYLRNPVFAVSVLLTFMLGIGATTAVFSVVDKILFRPLPYADADRLVSLGMSAPILPQEFLLGATYYDWREHQSVFESFSSEIGANPCDLTEQRPARLDCAWVESGLLPTLGVTPVAGRNFTPEEDRPKAPPVALISYRLWKERFNRDPGAIDKLLSLDGRDVRIVGVLPANFEMPTLEPADVLVPQALDETEQRHLDPGHVFYAFARLKPGVTLEQAHRELEPVFEQSLNQAPAQFRKEIHLQVRSLRDRQMHDVHAIAWVLFAVVLTVLLIACANVAGLLMARAALREREFAVRAALGASRVRLVQQALVEAVTLAVIAAFLGLALAFALLRAFTAIAPQGMPFLASTQLDLRIFAFALVVATLCGAACGLVAAFHRPRAEALAGRNSMAAPHARIRQLLVIAQIAASMVLLTGGALLYRSFRNLEQQRLGISTERLVSASVTIGQKNYSTQQQQMEFFQQLQRRIQYGPGIQMFAMSDSLPPGGWHHEHIRASILVNGVRFTDGTGGLVAWRWATPDYFRLLQIPLLQGTGFTPEQQDSNDHFIVLSRLIANELFPSSNPIGAHLQVAGGGPTDPQYTVVGVVADAKNGGLAGGDEPEYYRLRRNRPEDWNATSILIVKTTLPPATIAGWVRSQVSQLDPTVPVEVETLSQRVRKMADQPLFETFLVGLFAATGLIMAMVGLYGVMAFLVARRTQEIGLRMALGADRFDILRLVLSSGLRLVLTGIFMGLAAALSTSRVLAHVLFNVGPHDPITFSATTLLLLSVATAATLIPAAASSRMDPMNALRQE